MNKSVKFAANVQLNLVPKLDIELIPELFYSKYDYRPFKSEETFREERAVSRAIRRMVGNAIMEMDARLESCQDVQQAECELLSQSASEIVTDQADLVAICSDEDTDEDDDDSVKPLNIREEKVKARRRSTLLAVPSYKSHAFEDEDIGVFTKPKTFAGDDVPLDDSFNFIDKTDLAFEAPRINLNDLSGMDFTGSMSVDLSFTPMEFETVMDEASRKPCLSPRSKRRTVKL